MTHQNTLKQVANFCKVEQFWDLLSYRNHLKFFFF